MRHVIERNRWQGIHTTLKNVSSKLIQIKMNIFPPYWDVIFTAFIHSFLKNPITQCSWFSFDTSICIRVTRYIQERIVWLKITSSYSSIAVTYYVYAYMSIQYKRWHWSLKRYHSSLQQSNESRNDSVERSTAL